MVVCNFKDRKMKVMFSTQYLLDHMTIHLDKMRLLKTPSSSKLSYFYFLVSSYILLCRQKYYPIFLVYLHGEKNLLINTHPSPSVFSTNQPATVRVIGKLTFSNQFSFYHVLYFQLVEMSYLPKRFCSEIGRDACKQKLLLRTTKCIPSLDQF